MTVAWFDGATLTFEVGLASAPSVAIASTTWTDISPYARGIQSQMGRNTEFDTFNAATLTLTLNNTDRRFDPNNAASPYFGNLLPMKRIRVRVTYSGTTYPLWSGYVDDWPQTYMLGDAYAEVPLHCTDGFKVLSNRTLPVDDLTWELTQNTSLSPAPAAWWRLGEQSGTTAYDSSGNGLNGSYFGGATFNTRTGLLKFTSDNAIGFDGVADFAFLPNPVSAYGFTVAFWFSTTAAECSMFLLTDGPASRFCQIKLTSGTFLAQTADNGAGASRVTQTAATYNDGLTHFCMVRFDDSLAPTVYIDGASTGSTSGSGTSSFPTSANIYLAAVPPSSYYAVAMDDVIIWPADMVGFVSLLYASGAGTTYTAFRPSEMAKNVLDLIGWPAADRDLVSPSSANGFVWGDSLLYPGPKAALELLQILATTEQGQLYMNTAGQVVLREHLWRMSNAAAITSNATFGDSGGELRYADIVTDGGAQFLRNRIRVSSPNLSTIDVTDATSTAAFLEWTDDVTMAPMSSTTDTSQYRADVANWRLATLKNPVERITSLVVKPRQNPTGLFPQVLGRQIGERVTVKRRPPGGGTVNTFAVLIEGISHNVTPEGEWDTTWYLSSADTLDAFLLDDAALGLLDTGRLGF